MTRTRPFVLIATLSIACTLVACDAEPKQVEAASARTVTVETPEGPKDFQTPFGTEGPKHK